MDYARWIAACVKDRILSKQSFLGDGWSEELLTGSRGKSNKGIIDLCMYNLDMNTYLLGGLLGPHPFQSEAKVDLRAIFQSHESYRLLFKPVAVPPLEQDSPRWIAAVDLGFMGSWRKSTERLCELVEELWFMSKHAGLLKVAMKARKTPTEYFTSYEGSKEKTDEVLKEKPRMRRRLPLRRQKQKMASRTALLQHQHWTLWTPLTLPRQGWWHPALTRKMTPSAGHKQNAESRPSRVLSTLPV